MARHYLRLELELRIHLHERRRLSMQRRTIRDAQNPFEVRDVDFEKFFRVPKEVAHFICAWLEPTLRKKRSSGLSPQTQVLVTLRFLAEGGYQRGVGQDFLFPISQPSVSNCIKKVCKALCNNQQAWIKFPKTNNERSAIEQRFRPLIGFPGVIGAIDCTHIAIVTPIENEEGYKNHKGFYSLNVQMICDNDMRITNVRMYPGSVHDQFIWNWSPVKRLLRETHDNRLGKFLLLGDSGYALEPWLMTPLPHAREGTPEYRYTNPHCKTRNVVERLFGVMKMQWRCLHKDRVLHYQPKDAAQIILACAVLHNILMHHRVPLPDNEDDNYDYYVNNEHFEDGERLTVARRYQQSLIHEYFQ